jgi:flagellar protein FliO/FliZ
MKTSSDIWLAFGQTFAMLALVLAVLILVFYLIKKFSTAKGIAGNKKIIQTLAVHHLAPKEKLVLLNVLGETILVGVTSSSISKIASFDKAVDLPLEKMDTGPKFSHFLAGKLGVAFKGDSK